MDWLKLIRVKLNMDKCTVCLIRNKVNWISVTCMAITACLVSSTVAVTMTFDGHQYLTMTFATEVRNEIEDISLRLKTERSNGLLLMTSSNATDDMLMISLDGGRLRVDITIDDYVKVSIKVLPASTHVCTYVAFHICNITFQLSYLLYTCTL